MESSMTSAREFFRFCEAFQRVVPANAGTHTARPLNSALEQRPFFNFEARGDGSLRSQGRPAESLCEATTASTSIPPYAIALPASGRGNAPPLPRHRGNASILGALITESRPD